MIAGVRAETLSLCNVGQRYVRAHTYRHRMAIEYAAHAWDDTNDMPLSMDGQRKRRIAELLEAFAAMRPARRDDDPARFIRLERELILLLDAELIAIQQTRARPS
jgi:hypothetical protein